MSLVLWRHEAIVCCVESLGLRTIQPTARDWARVWKRLRRALQSPRPVRPGIWVCAPLILPGIAQGPCIG